MKSAPKKPESCSIVVFGASGDLTKRKLVPALFNLKEAGLLPEKFRILGIARKEMTSEQFQEKAKIEFKEFLTSKRVDMKAWNEFISHWEYVSGDFDDAKTFDKIKKWTATGNALFYLATPPNFFSSIIQQLASHQLTEEKAGSWRRVVIEKPFGRDLKSAMSLNQEIKKVMKETQAFRIDHYLGKETVQNIMVFRFANGMFEPIWNRNYIDSVQISVAETLGIESRASYYETSGALRDMVPNHLFQLMSLIGMEPPSSFDADAVRNEKEKVLTAIRPLTHADILTQTVRGQYKGYRQEEGVDPKSNTETFAALKLFIDNWRWAEVPFYLRTGKKLKARTSEIRIRFKCAPFLIFRDTHNNLRSNELIIQIQPEEKISLSFEAKVPGPDLQVRPVTMEFNYAETFHEVPTTGYETLIYDCMVGDATLFQRSDQVESAWKIVDPILQVWGALAPPNFPNYEPGTWGPDASRELLAADKREWRESDAHSKANSKSTKTSKSSHGSDAPV